MKAFSDMNVNWKERTSIGQAGVVGLSFELPSEQFSPEGCQGQEARAEQQEGRGLRGSTGHRCEGELPRRPGLEAAYWC